LFLIRKKSRTVTMLLILTIIASLVLTCLAIGRAADIAAAGLRASLGGYFKIMPDYEGGSVGFTDDKLVRDVIRGGGIRAFNGMDIQYLMTDGLQLTPGRFASLGDPKARMARFLANTDSSLHEYFYLRSFRLAEGRQITPDDRFAAVISDVLAADNGLSVGDTFTASYLPETLQEDAGNIRTQFDYTVVGIYEISSGEAPSSGRAECDIQENFIFTDTASCRAMRENLTGTNTTRYANGVVFFVEDPRALDMIVGHLQDIQGYDWDGFRIVENNKAYNDAALPLERLSALITTFLVVILLMSVVMLTLILIMWMKDRKHETGILLSAGIRKASVVAQHVAENLLIAAFAFLLAWGVSSLAADRVGGALLGGIIEEAETAEDERAGPEFYYDPVELQEVRTAELLSVRSGVTEFLLIVGIGFLIVIVSTGLSSIMVIRMKPKEILSSFS
jgi:ABC-type antimicrobial peptide transport system permease subunit